MSNGPRRPEDAPAASFFADALAFNPLVVAAPHGGGAAGDTPFLVRLHNVDAAAEAGLAAVLAPLDGRLRSGAGRAVLAEVPAAAVSGLQAEAVQPRACAALRAVAFGLQAWQRRDFDLACGGRVLRLGGRPLVMGILNCTPDSFWCGSSVAGEAAVERGEAMVAAGADLLDVGGESTRPHSDPVSAEEEIARVEPVIRELAKRLPVPISIDTTKAVVAEAAVAAGATLINDISGLAYDPGLAAVAARQDLPLVLMHMRGRPGDMYEKADYDDVVVEVAAELRDAVGRARQAGVRQVLVDPGIGFAKRAPASLALLNRLAVLRSLGCPILVGASRKSFIGAVLDLPVEERLEGTAAAVAASVLAGAHIVRVHDVEAMRRVAMVAAAIRDEGVPCSR